MGGSNPAAAAAPSRTAVCVLSDRLACAASLWLPTRTPCMLCYALDPRVGPADAGRLPCMQRGRAHKVPAGPAVGGGAEQRTCGHRPTCDSKCPTGEAQGHRCCAGLVTSAATRPSTGLNRCTNGHSNGWDDGRMRAGHGTTFPTLPRYGPTAAAPPGSRVSAGLAR